MSLNSLLLWMSARGEGSWSQFRSAVEELHLPSADATLPPLELNHSAGLSIYWNLRLNLQRLGHVEFAAGAGDVDWRVTPPVLALTPKASGMQGVLVGARSDRLLGQIVNASDRFHLATEPAPLCPDVIRVHGLNQLLLQQFADAAGLRVQPQAPKAILMCLPVVDDRNTRRASELPIGSDWRIERFSTRELRWTDSARAEIGSCNFGLFRFSLRYQTHSYLCISGKSFAVPGQVGKYAVLRHYRRRVIHYDAAGERLSVPASCRPPFLVERALILCSGAPPSYEARTRRGSMLHYRDVRSDIARLAVGVLRQELLDD